MPPNSFVPISFWPRWCGCERELPFLPTADSWLALWLLPSDYFNTSYISSLSPQLKSVSYFSTIISASTDTHGLA